MVKEPRAGRVKTRLARDIGAVRAAWWFRHRVSALLRDVQSPKWQTILSVAPDTALTSRALPLLPRIAQGPGDLGERMARIFRCLPPGPVLIVGADIPGITAAHVAAGFAALGSADAVFGPATDGGYWAVGLKRARAIPNSLFRNVRWSTEHALTDTLASIPAMKVDFLPSLQDVDTASDLDRLSR